MFIVKKKFDIEKGFISKLLETKDMLAVKDKQIKESYLSGDNKRVFIFINDFFIKNGELPTVRVFKQKFPKYALESYTKVDSELETVGTEESINYWCDEIRARVKHNTLAEVTEKMAQHLDKLETDTAYDLMKQGILKVENEIVETTSVDITKDTEDRKQLYLERRENKGMLGIPTGIDKLDYILKGSQKGTLTTMIAKTGIGKTFFQVLVGAYAQLNNYKVLQFVTEMSEEQMRDRYEAVLFGMMCGNFNYSKFKSGTFSNEEQKEYFNFLENKLPRLEKLIIETATGISSVSAKVEQHDPDLIMIDSAYLMEDERGARDDWLRVTHITRDLKLLSKRKKKPILINTQAVTGIKTGPELESIGFSKAIGHDSDVVLALFQDEIMRADAEMKVKILKNREGTLGNVLLNWNFKIMDFSSIYSIAENIEQGEGNKDSGNEMPGVIKI